MARQERSAGVILFRLSDTKPPQREYLLLNYGRHWDFPKGHVEKGEDLIQTALRELEEETGITDAQVVPGFAREIEYFFRDRRGSLIHKTVWFCLSPTSMSNIRLSDEHVGYEFLPYDAALKKLTFAGSRGILRQAEEFLSKDSHDLPS